MPSFAYLQFHRSRGRMCSSRLAESKLRFSGELAYGAGSDDCRCKSPDPAEQFQQWRSKPKLTGRCTRSNMEAVFACTFKFASCKIHNSNMKSCMIWHLQNWGQWGTVLSPSDGLKQPDGSMAMVELKAMAESRSLQKCQKGKKAFDRPRPLLWRCLLGRPAKHSFNCCSLEVIRV